MKKKPKKFYAKQVELFVEKNIVQKFAKVFQSIKESDLSKHGLTIKEAQKTMTSFTVDGVKFYQFQN